ncbi:acyl-ACP thioesterase [Oenococcus oeni]|uniref:acyl-[acyl-carrier-protein] thioesterase n=1 Tax=Oenococcus oeni TaxID=1247 RepID=UPI0008F7F61D|nr:acyl-ACP thioesterase domain-containing protein [Oenococcus oeni]OIK86050.1 acyl-ACP thioesterase [Oenococcus oeni]OIL08506.1 acyl-ACP thioesterase [Oenococcus oeni]OIL12726.1 acyl-ACP thioesterase [Oenococcus oeni]
MSEIYSEELYIEDFYCDRTAKLSLPMITELAISVSSKQTVEMGIGMQRLVEAHHGWILLQYDIKINRRPNLGEKIKIRTDPKRHNRFFAFRDFDFFDQDGNTLIHIDSLWAMIDLKRRRLVSIDSEFVDPLKGNLVDRLERLEKSADLDRSFSGASISVEEIKANYFDIDTNQHVNNSNYLKFFLVPVAENFLLRHEPKRILIKYVKEIRLNQSVVSMAQFIGPLHSVHEISDNSLINAQAEIEWSEVE